MEEEVYKFFAEEGIKIVFAISRKLRKFLRSKRVILTSDPLKNDAWRNDYENKGFDSNKLFSGIVNDILKKFSTSKKIYIDGYLPVPFYVALGARKTLSLISRNDEEKADFKKLKVKNRFKLLRNQVELIKKKRISKIPSLLVLESKNVSNEKHDFLIRPKKNIYKRNSISIGSLKKQIKNFIKEINKINARKRIRSIDVSIVASPAVCFFLGKALSRENYIFKIYHFSMSAEKNILKAQIGPDMKILML